MLAIVIVSLGSGNSDSAYATNLTPTKFPTKVPTAGPTKIPESGSTGSQSGVTDIHVHAGSPAAGALYYCQSRTDHYADNSLKTNTLCYIDYPGTGHPSGSSSTYPPYFTNPGDADLDLQGPPPPPPYSGLPPAKGTGTYSAAAGGTVTAASCFRALGGTLGPNAVSIVTLTGVDDGQGDGTVDIYFNQGEDECVATTPAAGSTPDTLPLRSTRVADENGVCTGNLGEAFLGRTVANCDDYDNDGCNDADELDKLRPVKNCGRDPYNPHDSDVNFDGPATVTVQTTPPDVCLAGAPNGALPPPLGCMGAADGTIIGGSFFNCIADIQHNKATNAVAAPIWCYSDNPLQTTNCQQSANSAANPCATNFICVAGGGTANQAHCGDGQSGGIGPSFSRNTVGAAETGANCIDTEDDDADTVANDGCPSTNGDNDGAPGRVVLKGWVDKTNNLLVLQGCFPGLENPTLGPNAYARAILDAHTLTGTVDIWLNQGSCAKPGGAPTQDNRLIVATEQNDGTNSDDDQCSDEEELGAVASAGGLRDPFWRFDFMNANSLGGNDVDDIFFITNPARIFKLEGQVGYVQAADRGAIPTQMAGSVAPGLPAPSRAIDVDDVFASSSQFANNC
jgi:hypothetical protein